MKTIHYSSLAGIQRYRVLVALWLIFLATVAGAAEPRPLRVLFLGHESKHHDSGACVPLLMSAMGREAIYFDYFTKPDCLNAETLGHYDALMLYANHDTIKPEEFVALRDFVESGHGFLPIHCASACFGNDPRFIALLGGRFKEHQTGIFKAEILDKAHPVMTGVNEYETWDETYVHDQIIHQGRKLLAERVEGAHREPWTWVREQGKGRVFYTASGHDQRTWENADFQTMLRNAIVWSVGDKARGEWEVFLRSRENEQREKSPHVANYEKRPEPLTFQEPFSVKGAMERTQVPADCRLELFASEPQIGKPIAFAWDERGRLWIAETSDYPHVVNPDGSGGDRIKICEDTDGDGKADKFTVFAVKLNIPTGLVFARGGVIVSQPPRFLFLVDTDGDDKADSREELLKGWGIGDTHGQAGNLRFGHDNWLYGSVGYNGFDGTVGGNPLHFSMGTYRFKADGSALEFLHQFTNNTWAQSANDAGDQFGGTANGAPIFYGGIPANVVPPGARIMTAKKINVVDAAHPITPNVRQVDFMGGYTAACNATFIRSNNLPPRLQGMAMVCEPTLKLIALMDVRPDGAGYKAFDAMNLFASTDEWTSPVYAEVGPDGAVWVADWQNFIIQHNPTPSVANGGYNAKTGVGGAHENPLRDHSRGRIYRIVWDQAKPVKKSLNAASAAQLVAALNDDVSYWRLLAQKNLVEGEKVDGAESLKKLVLAENRAVGAIHALWSLHGLKLLDEPTHKAALLSKDARLRRNAVRALGSDAGSQALYFGSGIVADPDLTTRLAAFVKLAEFETSEDIQTLVKRLGSDTANLQDEWLKEALTLLAKKHNAGSMKFAEGPNLLPNPGLEEIGVDGFPKGWQRRDYNDLRATAEAKWSIVSGADVVHGGKHAFRCITSGDADTSFFADVPLKPNTEYKLSAWVKATGLRGNVSLNDHIGRAQTELLRKDSGWKQVQTTFNSHNRLVASINMLHVAKGEGWFDDVSLVELIPVNEAEEKVVAGDPNRGEGIFWKHPVAACVNCHMLAGKGSTVGPALDSIATRRNAEYLRQSLLEPNKVLAEGYQQLGSSPMPPMGLILKAQEIADVEAFLLSLK